MTIISYTKNLGQVYKRITTSTPSSPTKRYYAT